MLSSHKQMHVMLHKKLLELKKFTLELWEFHKALRCYVLVSRTKADAARGVTLNILVAVITVTIVARYI